MQRSTFVPGIRPVTLLNMAVFRSLSARSIAAAVTWFDVLSFCATNAARDEVTTSSAMRMNDRAAAETWIATVFRDRRRRDGTVGSGSRGLIPGPSDQSGPDLSASSQVS